LPRRRKLSTERPASWWSIHSKPAGTKSSWCSAGVWRSSWVQVAHQALHAGVQRVVQQVPVQALVVVPLALLRELAAHEQQLLARVREHEAVVGPQVGELLPAVAGHARQQRTLAVHDLVVRDRKHEVFAESVDEAEGDLAMVVTGAGAPGHASM
jgi:hypothetical protein